MASDGETSLLPLDDYEAIAEAVMETQRGRWFLAEYARRNRQADTEAIVETLERLERTIKRDRAAPDIDRIRLDLADMAEAIARTKQEIAEMAQESEAGGRFQQASLELDAIVSQTETATNNILLNAEKIQELAWTMRENGGDEALCDALDVCTTEIYTGCSFQDLTGQRTRKVVTVLRYLESRINTMIDIWAMDQMEHSGLPTTPQSSSDPYADSRPDAHLLNGPALEGHGVNQEEIDDLMFDSIDDIKFDAIETDEPEATPAEPPALAVAQADEPQIATGMPATTPQAIAEDEADVFAPAAASRPALSAPAPEPAIEAAAAAPEEPAVEAVSEMVEPVGEVLDDDLDMVAIWDEAEPAEVSAAAQADDQAEAAGASAETLEPDVFSQVSSATPAAPTATPPAPVSGLVGTQRVGNTLLSVEIAGAPETEASPALALVRSTDPIASMSVARRLTLFG